MKTEFEEQVVNDKEVREKSLVLLTKASELLGKTTNLIGFELDEFKFHRNERRTVFSYGFVFARGTDVLVLKLDYVEFRENLWYLAVFSPDTIGKPIGRVLGNEESKEVVDILKEIDRIIKSF